MEAAKAVDNADYRTGYLFGLRMLYFGENRNVQQRKEQIEASQATNNDLYRGYQDGLQGKSPNSYRNTTGKNTHE